MSMKRLVYCTFSYLFLYSESVFLSHICYEIVRPCGRECAVFAILCLSDLTLSRDRNIVTTLGEKRNA
jgi:hypothetical protein